MASVTPPFHPLSSPSISTFISSHPPLSCLQLCSSINDLKKLHAQIIKSGLARDQIAISRLLEIAATSPYSDMEYALLIFVRIHCYNSFIWNTMFRGLLGSDQPQEAIFLFYEMLCSSSVLPDCRTYPSLFKACGRIGAVEEGTQLHGHVLKLGYRFDSYVRNTLIWMYQTCGQFDNATKVFDETHAGNDVVSWNSLIVGLAKSGRIDESRKLFDEMPQKSDVLGT